MKTWQQRLSTVQNGPQRSDFGDNCTKLISLNLNKFNTIKVTNMKNMFNNCINIKILNLDSFNTQNCYSYESMFESCFNLTLILDDKSSNEKLRKNIPDFVLVIKPDN